ncbi:MAG: hypothetical protein AAGK97_14845, partial [Bacteroidota bacterium]
FGLCCKNLIRFIKIKLEELNEIEELEIVSKRSKKWYGHLSRFKASFIGTSSIASKVEFVNPEVLQFNFDETNKVLTAKAKAPLILKNEVLGYQIEYDLVNYREDRKTRIVTFVGYPKFTELEGSKSKHKKWNKNRTKAYLGSSQHFFKSVLSNSVYDEGYTIQELIKEPNPNRPSDEAIAKAQKLYREHFKKHKYSKMAPDSVQNVMRRSREPYYINKIGAQVDYQVHYEKLENGFYSLKFPNYWLISYNEAMDDYYAPNSIHLPRNKQYHIISMTTEAILMNKEGHLVDPLSVLFEEYWGFEKVGDSLPLDFGFEEE